MQVENNKEEVPFSHYESLFRALQPEAALERLPHVTFEAGRFEITLLGRRYAVAWPDYALEALDGESTPNLPTQTFLLRCLLEAKEVPWAGSWKTFREMPWGELYLQPFTGRCLTRSAYSFGTRLEAFRRACEKLGGKRIANGDAGYEFDFFGPYAMRIQVWEGDDEFPPNAQILYTDNFAAGFAAEDRVVAGDILINHIKRAM